MHEVVTKAGERPEKDTGQSLGYADLAAVLREEINGGAIAVGATLAPVKELAARHGVCPETARRAAKLLESEGLVAAHARQGFRVLARANDPARGLPVAFVVSGVEKAEQWDGLYQSLFACLQKAAAARGWPIPAVGPGSRSSRDVMQQLQDCRVCGVVLDSMTPDLLAEFDRVRLPVVMMDSWDSEMRLDAVVQDSFQGALLATQHLISRGHTRIGWLGKISQSVQSQERFGGVAAALAAPGLKARPACMLDTPGDKTAAAARALLSRPDRPTGVLGLWHDAALELVRAAQELKLKPGRDVEIVGWCAEELYESWYCGLFAGAPVPTTMVWSMAQLARLTIARLAERRAFPALDPALIKVPVRCRNAGCGMRNAE
jgi:LacI family transcriptional regulator